MEMQAWDAAAINLRWKVDEKNQYKLSSPININIRKGVLTDELFFRSIFSFATQLSAIAAT